MDACTYESITGLKNYYGFKSLLKNGAFTSRFSCDDDTIVFNRIESFTFGAGFNLNNNQVGVVLNLGTQFIILSGSSYIYDNIRSFDVDNQLIYLNVVSDNKGVVVRNQLLPDLSASSHFIVLAIFDLY
jgi:hypothetical protein